MSPSALWQGSSKAWSQPQFFTDEEIFSFQLSQGVAWLQGHQQKLRFGGVYPNFRHSFLAILEVCYMWDHLGMRQEARYPWLEHAHFGGGHPAKAKYKVLWNQSKEFNISFWTEGPHRLYMGVSMGFLKWGYPQIIHLNRIFHCKSSSYWGTPWPWNLYIDFRGALRHQVFAYSHKPSQLWVMFPIQHPLLGGYPNS